MEPVSNDRVQPLVFELGAMRQSFDPPDHGHSDLSVVEARQGVTLGRMRYVLGISLALAVASLFVILYFFSQP